MRSLRTVFSIGLFCVAVVIYMQFKYTSLSIRIYRDENEEAIRAQFRNMRMNSNKIKERISKKSEDFEANKLDYQSPGPKLIPIQVDNLRLFVYSAVIHKRTTTSQNLDIRIQALNGEPNQPTFQCCFHLADKTISNVNASIVFGFPYGVFKSSIYKCLLPYPGKEIMSVSIQKTCENATAKALQLYEPERPEGLLSVCVHAVYGYIDPMIVIQWLEILWLQGIRSVYIYPLLSINNIDRRTLEVFKFYEKRGLVRLIPYELAVFEPEMTYERFKSRDGQMYSDEILPIYDCMMRSSDYTFTAVLDFDEIIVPKKGPLDLIPMLNHEYQHDEHAAAFVFRIENFILNWTTSNETNLHFMKYVKRTLALQDQSKIVYVQGRYKTVNMHTTEALRGFGIVFLPSKKAAVHHYTVCRPAWSQSSCLSEINRHHDRAMMGIETLLFERLKMVPDDLRLGK